MQRLTEEARYDEASRERILDLARELQRRDQEGETLTDLERRARAEGIDPKYIHQAANQLPAQEVALAAPDHAWYRGIGFGLASILLFIPAHGVNLIRVIEQGPTTLPFSCLFAFLMGIAFSRTRSLRLGALAAIAGSTLATLLFYYFFYGPRISVYTPITRWSEAVVALCGFGVLALAAGFAVNALGRSALRKFSPNLPSPEFPRG